MTGDQAERRLASWWSRVGAALLDFGIIWAIMFLAVIASAILTGGDDPAQGWLWLLLWLVGGGAYYAGTMTRKGAHNGQTWGKQAAGIRVVRDDGEPITLSTVASREWLAKFVGGTVTFGAGWVVDSLWPLGEREDRALHDLVVHTHVVDVKPPVQVRPQLPPWQAPQPQLAPGLARHLYAARNIEARIGDTVRRAQLPYGEVCREVNALVALMQGSAMRAQMLYDALAETPVASIERRLVELDGSGKAELIDALEQQLVVQRRMQGQLERYSDELERVVVELDTVRGNLISVSASTNGANQERLAEQVRALRDEMGSIAEGVNTAYER
jgi:uncharacterized RDD family membrane protein YckC